jgi:hypothetical protein
MAEIPSIRENRRWAGLHRENLLKRAKAGRVLFYVAWFQILLGK